MSRALALAMVLFATAPATAARFHVVNNGSRVGGPCVPGDWTLENCYGTVAAALTAAAPADTVLLSEETHTLATAATLSVLISNRSMLEAPGLARISVSGAGTLAVDANLPATEIRGLEFVGGPESRTVAALTVANPAGTVGSVHLHGCTFRQFQAGTQAGAGGSALRAVSPGNGMSLVMDECVFSGNQTQGNGGAVWIGGGYAVGITRCTFTDNHTSNFGYGGAVMVAAASGHSQVEISDCTFVDNTAAGVGGAINVDAASLTMRRCRVEGSRTAWAPGAFFKEGAGLRVARSGGHTDPVNVLVQDCEFRDNQGNLSDDNGAGDGGAILVKGGDVTRMTWAEIDNCLFQANTNAQGAGVYVGRFCQGAVRYCRFLDNISWYQGGGAFKGGELPECEGELVTFAYCEFRGNLAGFKPDGTETGEYCRGGGVMVRNHPRAHLFNCTFVDNRVNGFSFAVGDGFAHAEEGGEWTDINRCTLVNCAFWGQGGDIQVRCEGVGGMELVSHVAVATGQMSVPGCTPVGTVWLSSLPFVDPLDSHLAVDSPLIDAGTTVAYTSDLAGLPVPWGPAFDIGCYEDHSAIAVEDLPASESATLTAIPNPFNPRTSLRFPLATAAAVDITIYDSRGRQIRQLLRADLPAGSHELRWNGEDDQGRAMAAGTYLARLAATGQAPVVAKLVLVR